VGNFGLKEVKNLGNFVDEVSSNVESGKKFTASMVEDSGRVEVTCSLVVVFVVVSSLYEFSAGVLSFGYAS
jgi:hypothetical protein